MSIRKAILVILISSNIGAYAQQFFSTEKHDARLRAILELPHFERAVCCIKFYEGMHRQKDYPYMGYGHRLQEGETYSPDMTTSEAELLLRKDLKILCSLFKHYGKDSLLLAVLSYNIGPYKVLGNKNYPKSTLLKKLECGNRDIKEEYVKYCHWKGKKITSIERRRYAEYMLLYTR